MSYLHIWGGVCAQHSQQWQYPWGKIGCWGRHSKHSLGMESICTLSKPFLSEKTLNSSDLMKGKSNHVDNANFSSPLSANLFSCKMRVERLRFYDKENITVIGCLIEYCSWKIMLISHGNPVSWFSMMLCKKIKNKWNNRSVISEIMIVFSEIVK